MRHRYHYGDAANSLDDAIAHRDRECPDMSGEARPLADSTVESGDVTRCPTCSDGEPSGTCDVEKSDGEVCGRDRPCPYHD